MKEHTPPGAKVGVPLSMPEPGLSVSPSHGVPAFPLLPVNCPPAIIENVYGGCPPVTPKVSEKGAFVVPAPRGLVVVKVSGALIVNGRFALVPVPDGVLGLLVSSACTCNVAKVPLTVGVPEIRQLLTFTAVLAGSVAAVKPAGAFSNVQVASGRNPPAVGIVTGPNTRFCVPFASATVFTVSGALMMSCVDALTALPAGIVLGGTATVLAVSVAVSVTL